MFSFRALCKQGLIAHCTRILSGLLIIIDNCAIDLSVYLSVWQPDHPIRGTTLETPNVCVGSNALKCFSRKTSYTLQFALNPTWMWMWMWMWMWPGQPFD